MIKIKDINQSIYLTWMKSKIKMQMTRVYQNNLKIKLKYKINKYTSKLIESINLIIKFWIFIQSLDIYIFILIFYVIL
jgi:hypothetical protein